MFQLVRILEKKLVYSYSKYYILFLGVIIYGVLSVCVFSLLVYVDMAINNLI